MKNTIIRKTNYADMLIYIGKDLVNDEATLEKLTEGLTGKDIKVVSAVYNRCRKRYELGIEGIATGKTTLIHIPTEKLTFVRVDLETLDFTFPKSLYTMERVIGEMGFPHDVEKDTAESREKNSGTLLTTLVHTEATLIHPLIIFAVLIILLILAGISITNR